MSAHRILQTEMETASVYALSRCAGRHGAKKALYRGVDMPSSASIKVEFMISYAWNLLRSSAKNWFVDGYAVGGLAVGEGQEIMFRVLDGRACVPSLPQDKPRYLMGVGKPDDIVGAVQRGIDMFDCVMPTRSGRTGARDSRAVAPSNIRNVRAIKTIHVPFGRRMLLPYLSSVRTRLSSSSVPV